MAQTTSDTEYEAGLASDAADEAVARDAGNLMKRHRAAVMAGIAVGRSRYPDDQVEAKIREVLGGDATDIAVGIALASAGWSLAVAPEAIDVKVDVDPTLLAIGRAADALERLADAKHLPPEPMVLAKHKFRVLCMDVLGHMHDAKEPTRIAEIVIGGVYSGHIAFRRLREAIDRSVHLTPDERAFCHGLCAGFMVDFLPRVRG